MFPNQHDELLADLAALAAPALDDVVFEEIPPTLEDDEQGRGTYRLFAYADGKRLAVDARSRGDWYDVEAVMGLVNALLVERKSDVRLVVLPTTDQTVKVLAGPVKGIESLVERRLISVGDASEAERIGKEFEERVLEKLQRQGHEVLRDVQVK